MSWFRPAGGYGAWLLSLAVIAAYAYVLFGLTGFRTIVSIALLFVIPPALFLKNSSLDAEEKIFFSLFIGIGMFSLLAWVVNQVLPSFRLSVLAAFAAVIAVSLLVPKVLKSLGGKTGMLGKKPQ